MEQQQAGQDDAAIECIAVDPGLVHHAICHLRFRGYRYVRVAGEKSGESFIRKTPQFDILHWELWNLKTKVTYRPTAEQRVHTEKYENKGESSDSLQVMAQNLAHIVQTTEWLRDRPVQLISELQCAHVKAHEIDPYVVAHLLVGCICTQDRAQGLGGARRIVSEARKYGLPSDGALTYDQRKRKAEEITRNLLRDTGKRDWATFLDLCESAQRRDRPGKTPQSHDLCDALLLGLQHCTNEWEEREKRNDNAKAPTADQLALAAAEASPVVVVATPFDPEEDDELEARPKRKRRAPGEAKTAKPKKTTTKKKNATVAPVKKRNTTVITLRDSDEEDSAEEDEEEEAAPPREEPVELRKRKRAATPTKKASVSRKKAKTTA